MGLTCCITSILFIPSLDSLGVSCWTSGIDYGVLLCWTSGIDYGVLLWDILKDEKSSSLSGVHKSLLGGDWDLHEILLVFYNLFFLPFST